MRKGRWIDIEREVAVVRLLREDPPLSERQIALRAGVARGTVAYIRDRVDSRQWDHVFTEGRTRARRRLPAPELVEPYLCQGCVEAGAVYCRTSLIPCPACEARKARRKRRPRSRCG